MTITLDRARKAKRSALLLLDQLAPEAAIGLGRKGNSWFLKVNSERRLEHLPPDIDGVPLIQDEVGRISKFGCP